MTFERLAVMPYSALGLDEKLRQVFLLPTGGVGTHGALVTLEPGVFPSPNHVVIPLEVPRAWRALATTHVFLRRPNGIMFLGLAQHGDTRVLTLIEPLPEALWLMLVEESNAPSPGPAEEAIAALTPTSTTDDRLAALRVFMHRWYGCDPNAPERDIRAPRPLRVVLGLHEAFSVQNFVRLSEVKDKLVFYVENQGCFQVATDFAGDDPPVYIDADRWKLNWTWKLEGPSLSDFLLGVVLTEALMGAPFMALTTGAEAGELSTILQHVPPLALSPWSEWGGTRFIGGGGVIGFVNGDMQVSIASKDRDRLEPLTSLVASGWDHLGL